MQKKANLMERLDNLRKLIQDQDFIEGKGLSNEVNIRIFCYDPKDEMIIRHFTEQIITDSTLKSRIIECNLYKVFLSICEDMDILDSIIEMEETDGPKVTLAELEISVRLNDYLEVIKKIPHKNGDVLLLTGIGDVYPFMRVSNLLEPLTAYYSKNPILVFYPGEYSGYDLKLFSRLQPKDHYRAFNIM